MLFFVRILVIIFLPETSEIKPETLHTDDVSSISRILCYKKDILRWKETEYDNDYISVTLPILEFNNDVMQTGAVQVIFRLLFPAEFYMQPPVAGRKIFPGKSESKNNPVCKNAQYRSCMLLVMSSCRRTSLERKFKKRSGALDWGSQWGFCFYG